MSGNMQVSLLLKAVDQASSVLKHVSQQANTLAERAARTAKDGQTQTQRAYRETAQVFNRSVTDQTRLAERAAQTREQSVVRAENAIQREVSQTEVAYRRVSQTSTASAMAQQRAFAGVSAQARRTTADLQAMSRQQEQMARQARQGRGSGAGNVVGAVAGVAAAGMVLQRPMMDQRDYDLRLRYAANTAFSDRDLVGRERGVGELDALIRKATLEGGTRDGALGALDTLMGSGALGDNSTVAMRSAQQLLPTLMKYSNAANADPNEIASIAIKAKQQYGMSDAELPRILDMAMMGGKLGGFELKDMAKWLPQQMAAAKMAGLSGPDGLAKLIALNQKAVIAAGSKDEAGNNVVNFLAKLNAEETSKDMKKIGVKDWRGMLLQGREKGKDAVEVFGDVMNAMMQGDKRYRALKTRAAGMKSGSKEQQELIGQMTDIVMGAVAGKIQTDRQEMMGAIGYITDRKGTEEIEKKVASVKVGSVVDTDNALIRKSDAWKSQQGDNAWQSGSNRFFASWNEQWANAKLGFSKWMQDDPVAASATVGGGTVASAAGGAYGLQSLFARLSGSAATGSAPSVFSRAAAAAPGAGSLAIGAAPLGVMAGVTNWAQNQNDVMPWLKSLNEWTNSLFGKQAEFDARREAQLKELVSTPIQVVVKVENGNITAQLAQWQAVQAGRH